MRNSITLSILLVVALLLFGCDQGGELVHHQGDASPQEAALARTAAENSGEGIGTLHERSFVHDGTLRSYLLYVPAAYDGKDSWPLVIDYHGFRLTGALQRSIDRMDVVADAAHFLLAYPNGLTVDDPLDGPPSTGWNFDGIISQNDDVGFTNKLVDHVTENYRVDPTRIHATGYSMGMQMSWTLACQLSNRIASVAGVSGPMDEASIEKCSPKRPTSVMLIHGTGDPLFPPEGVEASRHIFPPPNETPTFWAQQNNCLSDPRSKDIKDVVADDNSTVTRFKYTSCDDRTEVLYYRVNNGGHTWPGGSFPGGEWPEFIGPVNQDINASAEIWDFFARNPHPGTVQVCHAPPGNPANARTITVSVNALPAHLTHGDTEGPCDE